MTIIDGIPDYSAKTFAQRRPSFDALQARLLAMDTSGWTVPERVDWHIVWAEMNGYDFNDHDREYPHRFGALGDDGG